MTAARLVTCAAAALLGGCAAAATSGGVVPPPPAGADAGPTVPAPGRGREFAYAAAPLLRYRIERTDTVLLHLPDNTTQPQSFSRGAWLTVSTEKSAEGLRATIDLDSLAVSGMIREAASAAIDSARGTRWTATVGPDGRLSQIAANRTTLVGGQVGSMLQLLFPVLPGPAIRAGAAWTDTTEATKQVDLFEVRERAITGHIALSPAVRGGSTVLPILADASFSQEGSGAQAGQSMQIESTGTRRFTHYLGTDGVPAGLSGTEASEVSITVTAVGQTIRATRSGTIEITRLPGR